MTRSWLSMSHFCIALHHATAPVEAERLPARLRGARRGGELGDVGRESSGTCAMTSPVAGFSTGISAPAPRPFVLWSPWCPRWPCQFSSNSGWGFSAVRDRRRRSRRRASARRRSPCRPGQAPRRERAIAPARRVMWFISGLLGDGFGGDRRQRERRRSARMSSRLLKPRRGCSAPRRARAARARSSRREMPSLRYDALEVVVDRADRDDETLGDLAAASARRRPCSATSRSRAVSSSADRAAISVGGPRALACVEQPAARWAAVRALASRPLSRTPPRRRSRPRPRQQQRVLSGELLGEPRAARRPSRRTSAAAGRVSGARRLATVRRGASAERGAGRSRRGGRRRRARGDVVQRAHGEAVLTERLRARSAAASASSRARDSSPAAAARPRARELRPPPRSCACRGTGIRVELGERLLRERRVAGVRRRPARCRRPASAGSRSRRSRASAPRSRGTSASRSARARAPATPSPSANAACAVPSGERAASCRSYARCAACVASTRRPAICSASGRVPSSRLSSSGSSSRWRARDRQPRRR